MRTREPDEILANHTGQEIRELHEVLGRESVGEQSGDYIEIAIPVTNGDDWNTTDVAQRAILDQIKEACAARDKALEEYRKAKPLAERAQGKSMGFFYEVRKANERALKLRQALEALKKVPDA